MLKVNTENWLISEVSCDSFKLKAGEVTNSNPVIPQGEGQVTVCNLNQTEECLEISFVGGLCVNMKIATQMQLILFQDIL